MFLLILIFFIKVRDVMKEVELQMRKLNLEELTISRIQAWVAHLWTSPDVPEFKPRKTFAEDATLELPLYVYGNSIPEGKPLLWFY